jgi:hypothetical protein
MDWQEIKEQEQKIAARIDRIERGFACIKEQRDQQIQALRDQQRQLGIERNRLAQKT